MSDHSHPIWTILDKLQMDVREMGVKLVELRAFVSSLELPRVVEYPCPVCGITFRRASLRDEHHYTAHAGPVPEHYLAAERLAGE